jgi:Ca-activated chloride channel family protein
MRILFLSQAKRRIWAASLAAVLLAVCGLPVASQEPQGPIIRREVNLALVEATVKDKSGRVMGELKKEDFQLLDNGQPQEIAHFSRDQIPLAVALVVDLSESIRPFLRPLRYASISSLKVLKPEDEVALFTFSYEPELRKALTKEKLDVSSELEYLDAGGATNINDAVFEAARYLNEERPAARRVIILVSDNVASGNHRHSGRSVIEEALRADAAVYNVKVPGRNPMLGRAMASIGGGHVSVKDLTAETGGEIFDVQKEGSLFLALQTVIERLKTRYTLGFYPPGGAKDGAFHRLDIRLQSSFGRNGSDYSVVSKRGYYTKR